MQRTADVIIIGAGVIGAAVALELTKLGYKTLTVDRNTQAGHGSTAGSCACIRMHYSTFDGTAFAWEGYHYWRDWAQYLKLSAEHSLARYVTTGCLVMKTPENGHLEKHIEHSARLNCPCEEWSAEKIEQRLPIYNLESFAPTRRPDDPDFGSTNGERITGGVYWPNAGHVTDPALAAQNLVDAAKARGAEFYLGTEVVAILQSGGKTAGVQLSSGEELHAPVVVNVAGPASSKINAMADVLDDMTISTRALKQQVAYVPSPEGFDFEKDGTMVSDSDIGVYCRPELGNHILIGTQDHGCDEPEWVDDELHYNREFTEQWTTQAMRYAQRVPSLGIPQQASGIVDLYDTSTDWIPVYDRSSLPGFYMACGTSGNQFKNAPIAGKMMASLINYCEAGNDHDTKPLQFSLPYLDIKVNTAFYSRRRPVHKESSFSVVG